MRRRFPARDSPERRCWPLEASIGAAPVQDAKWLRFREAGNIADLGEDPRGVGRADRGDVHQVGSCRLDRSFELGSHRLVLGVQPVQVRELFGGHPAAGLARQVAGADDGQQGPVLAGWLLDRRSTAFTVCVSTRQLTVSAACYG